MFSQDYITCNLHNSPESHHTHYPALNLASGPLYLPIKLCMQVMSFPICVRLCGQAGACGHPVVAGPVWKPPPQWMKTVAHGARPTQTRATTNPQHPPNICARPVEAILTPLLER